MGVGYMHKAFNRRLHFSATVKEEKALLDGGIGAWQFADIVQEIITRDIQGDRVIYFVLGFTRKRYPA